MSERVNALGVWDPTEEWSTVVATAWQLATSLTPAPATRPDPASARRAQTSAAAAWRAQQSSASRTVVDASLAGLRLGEPTARATALAVADHFQTALAARSRITDQQVAPTFAALGAAAVSAWLLTGERSRAIAAAAMVASCPSGLVAYRDPAAAAYIVEGAAGEAARAVVLATGNVTANEQSLGGARGILNVLRAVDPPAASALDSANGMTRRLADFALDATPTEAARWAARRTILNAVGLGVRGAAAQASGTLRTALLDSSSSQTHLLGRHETASPAVAAMLNGFAIHLEDFDDTHLETVVHPGAPVVSAALAVGQQVDATFDEVVDTVAVAIEAMLRTGLALGSAQLERGWHVTATLGPVGAALAAARLMALDGERTEVAIGLACTQTGGVQAALGSMMKPLHPGRAAASGVAAAARTVDHAIGPRGVIEAPDGLAALVSDCLDVDRALAGLGTNWQVEDNAFKPYPCGIVAHPAIDAAIQAAEQLPIDAAQISAVRMRVNPYVSIAMGLAEPTSGLESKFSARHAVAVGLARGRVGLEAFSEDMVDDPTVAALRRRIEVVTDPAVRRDEAHLEVAADCQDLAVTIHVEHASGSRARPLTDQQLEDKVMLLVEPVLRESGARALVEQVWESGSRGLTDVLALTRPGIGA